MLLMKGAKEGSGHCHGVVVIILVRGHLRLHFVGFFYLAGHQEIGALFQHGQHLIVIKGKLKIRYSILKGDVVGCKTIFIALALLRIPIASVIFACPSLDLVDKMLFKLKNLLVFILNGLQSVDKFFKLIPVDITHD